MSTIQTGDAVEVRDASGNWHRAVAASGPRIDYRNAIRRNYYTSVAVVTEGADAWVNWPIEAVRVGSVETPKEEA